MNQSRLLSLIESALNVGLGFIISYWVGLVVYPLFGFQVSSTKVLTLTLIFTVASLARMYAIRRFFNGRLHQLALAIQGKLNRTQ